MTVSFTTLIPKMNEQIQEKLLQPSDFRAEFYYNVDRNYIIKVTAERALQDPGIPRGAQHSGHKMARDTAVIDIVPPNQELTNLVSDYFKSQKIPACMGAPARLLYDEVSINNTRII